MMLTVGEAVAARGATGGKLVSSNYLCLLVIRLLIPVTWVSVPALLKSADLISLLKHK